MLLAALALPAAAALDKPPVANAGPDQIVSVGETVVFSGTAVEPDGYIAKYEWDFEGDGIYEWSSVQNGDATHVYFIPAIFNATFRVTSDTNQMVTDTARITVKSTNRMPLAEAGPDQSAYAESTLLFSGTAVDFDGWITRYEWDFDGDGDWDYAGPNGTASHRYPYAGSYMAILRATDNAVPPANDTDMALVTIYAPNQPPSADPGDDLAGVTGTALKFLGKGSDPDGAISLYEWDFDGDGRWDFSSPTSGTAHWTYWVLGTYDAMLRVTDNAPIPTSEVATVTVTIAAANTPPVITGPELVKGAAGRPIKLSVFAVDMDAGDSVVRYAWDLDGNGIVDYQSDNGNADYTFNSSGTYTVKVTAYDSHNAASVWRFNVTVSEPAAAPSPIAAALPYAISLAAGIIAGLLVGVLFMKRYMKTHWDKYFKPDEKERTRMKAELEHEEHAARGFREGPDGALYPVDAGPGGSGHARRDRHAEMQAHDPSWSQYDSTQHGQDHVPPQSP